MTALTNDEGIKQRGSCSVLKELHDEIHRLTAEAYGWPTDLSDEEILDRLVALNAERAKEEAAGHGRWLRSDCAARDLAFRHEIGNNILADFRSGNADRLPPHR